MRPLRPGQDTVLSWSAGAVDCRVIAAAGAFVLLRPERVSAMTHELPRGKCALTFLDGMVPVGWDGTVEFGNEPGELRFQVDRTGVEADRRSSVRMPVFCDVVVTIEGEDRKAQVLDVSAGGMRFRSSERLEPGTPVTVFAELPSGGPTIAADAVVRASDPGMAAVEYTALHSTTAQEIGAWTVARLRASLGGQG